MEQATHRGMRLREIRGGRGTAAHGGMRLREARGARGTAQGGNVQLQRRGVGGKRRESAACGVGSF